MRCGIRNPLPVDVSLRQGFILPEGAAELRARAKAAAAYVDAAVA